MKKILLLLIFLSVSIVVYSQHTISGIVKDSETNNPIEYANVYLPELEKGTVTNTDGSFTVNNLPKGNYRLVITIIGYSNYTEQITIPTEKEFNIILSPSVINIDEII